MSSQEPDAGEHEKALIRAVTKDLRDHYFWFPRILVRARAWEWLIPWPLQSLFPPWGSNSRRQKTVGETTPPVKRRGSLWLTFVICLWQWIPVADVDIAACSGDVSKALLAGAFLVMTMLSVSVAIPGQAILQLMVKGDPLFGVEFVSPAAWAFVWGVIGGILMMVYTDFEKGTQSAVVLVALYGAAMEVNAVLYTIRMYLIGLIIHIRK